MGGSGGAGALGGSGGTAGAGGSLPSDAAEDATGGPEPQWADVGKAIDCTFQRITNPTELRLLRWVPCPGDSTCEQAEFIHPSLFPVGSTLQPRCVVHSDGSETIAGLGLATKEKWLVVFVDDDGHVVEGIRASSPNSDCSVFFPAVWGSRFAVRGADQFSVDLGRHPIATGRFGEANHSVFEIDTTAMGLGVPNRCPLGETRWVWDWAPKPALLSFATENGSGPSVFAKLSEEVFGFSGPDSAGTHFLFAEYLSVAGKYATRISTSDGIEPPTPYLVPGTDEDYGTPRFAHSHVGWFRGTGMQSENKYAKVEVWASTYSPDPSKLEPRKIGDHYSTAIHTGAVGGHGRFASSGLVPGLTQRSLRIWNLETGALTDRLTPAFADGRSLIGITRTHLWVTGSNPAGTNKNDYLFRFTVE
jgi:hypothetical protein